MDYDTAFALIQSAEAHLAPESGVLTVAQAHRAMCIHRGCQLAPCKLKALAVQTLREAGQMQPATDYDRTRR